MKEVKAYIRRNKLDDVVNALAKVEGLSGVSVSTITGFGRSRGVLQLVDFETHIKIEAVCSDELKETVVETMLRFSQTGYRGDGKVFVQSVEEAYRIETGEGLEDAP